MKDYHGIKFGGLQQKIFTLMFIFMIALIAGYVTATIVLQSRLTTIIEDTNKKQVESIDDVSEKTMEAILTQSMTKTTALQAYIADDLFSEVSSDVNTLWTFATELFNNADSFSPAAYYPPDKEKDGEASVQLIHEAGVDPSSSTSLSLVAHMSEIMLSMYVNSEKLGSCFVATADGCHLFVNDRSGAYFDEDGNVFDFPVRERPWYLQAVQAQKLIYTGVELDAYTDIPGLVCAAPVYHDGELVAVVGADVFLHSISEYVKGTNENGGFLCVVNENGQVLFSPNTEGIFKPNLAVEAPDLRQNENKELAAFVTAALKERTGLCSVEVDGAEYYMTGAPMDTVGWTVLSVVDKETTNQPTVLMLQNYDKINEDAVQVYQKSMKNSTRTIIILTVILVVMALAAALLLASKITKPLAHMTKRIDSLTGEDNVFEMEKIYKTKDEVQLLAESFASLSAKTRDYIQKITTITAEKERIGTELSLATRIQADMLPNIYPAFPERKEFDIYATMTPAREVGGDFYDFFLIDDDHLCLLIADVSGKGVPAALFMMASRIILASNAKLGKSPAEILTLTNETICQNNREEMFVTVWLGILEISTGKLTAANAGHEYPVLMRPNGDFELVKDKHGFVIGGMDGMKYKEYELQLEPGSKLFVYTDGVPEATDANNELFGVERMLKALNEDKNATAEEMLNNVRKAVDGFVKEAEQFDDLTMLSLEYKGEKQ